jgi:hypothetical protein
LQTLFRSAWPWLWIPIGLLFFVVIVYVVIALLMQ